MPIRESTHVQEQTCTNQEAQHGWFFSSKVRISSMYAYNIHRHTHKGQMVNMPQYQ